MQAEIKGFPPAADQCSGVSKRSCAPPYDQHYLGNCREYSAMKAVLFFGPRN